MHIKNSTHLLDANTPQDTKKISLIPSDQLVVMPKSIQVKSVSDLAGLREL